MPIRALLSCFLLASILSPGDLRHAIAAPGDPNYAEGRQQLFAGQHRDAEESFRKALRENPDHVEALYQLALLHSRNVLTYEQA
ncbi:MAG TPA: hypothetical protein VIS30_04935, partial [Candidatus Deferrimicrobiaceae bacterium]